MVAAAVRNGGLPVVAHRAAEEGIRKSEGNPPSNDDDAEDLHCEAERRGNEYAMEEVDGGKLSGCKGGGLEEGERKICLVFGVSFGKMNYGLERSSTKMTGQSEGSRSVD